MNETISLVNLTRQHESLGNELLDSITKVITENAFVGGPYVTQFEEAFADYCGVKYCVSLANGTDSLTLALLTLGIRAGDEVITTASSFFATAEAICHVGATPVFCDINPRTASISIQQIKEKISPRTKAIIPVHLYGQPANMEQIVEIACTHQLYIIEDCAQAVGARYADQRVGTMGDAGCFSFYPSKNLGAMGDGGALITNNENIAHRCRMLANHGGTKKYEHEIVGYNSRLDGIQAAILNIKLIHLDSWNNQRRKVAVFYRNKLVHPDITHLETIPGTESVHHLYIIRIKSRNNILKLLHDSGIGADIHYPIPLPLVPAFREMGNTAEQFPHATSLSTSILTLPIFPLMEKVEMEKVVNILLNSIERLK